MKPSKVVANTMVNYGALTARIWMTCVWMLPFSYSFNFSPAIKATLRGGVINITDEDNVINRYYKVDPNDNSNTVVVNTNLLA
jgi:hypothetical protein